MIDSLQIPIALGNVLCHKQLRTSLQVTRAMTTQRYVAYYRVSTAKQGASGLGLEAQQDAVRQYLRHGGYPPIAEFTDVESGASADRPGIAKAILHCQMTGAKLIVAKLDRLSRDSEFFYGRLKQSGIKWVAADNPEANDLTVDILIAVAKHERLLVSQRTKAAWPQRRPVAWFSAVTVATTPRWTCSPRTPRRVLLRSRRKLMSSRPGWHPSWPRCATGVCRCRRWRKS